MMITSLQAGSLRGEQWPHEGPLVAQDAAGVVADLVGGDELGIGAEPAAVGLVGSQRWEGEQRQGPVAGALGR
jgi:hypothetical protein